MQTKLSGFVGPPSTLNPNRSLRIPSLTIPSLTVPYQKDPP